MGGKACIKVHRLVDITYQRMCVYVCAHVCVVMHGIILFWLIASQGEM